MKKLGAIVVSVALMLTCTMSALAAPSPTVTVTSPTVSVPSPTVQVKATKAMVDGKSIDISKLKITKTDKTVDPATVDESLKNMAIAHAVDVNYDGEFKEIEITFAIPGIVKDENVKALHFTEDKWEVLTPDSVADQEVTVTFKSLSPVLFLVDKK